MFERESFYIKKYNAIEDGYNSASTTASTKEELLESLKHFNKNSEMIKYTIEIIRISEEKGKKSTARQQERPNMISGINLYWMQ
ncbi:hypothetical protein SAMN02745136_03823 [Anaerocolumna jejuensis DSM 15929]|uniref:Uncharacterized protein n=1 Tax=Anaerocolumna jejuensis DSM 15929 TaxID=1121322 RepID=A0A1M6WZF7_9FIRM|nr:hypothetical protein [Anaerocolumna jejuensis]SHK99117.1 hypothetical protein SAMN02745136_03823 [Anaerocolumna jejuensis DSM 15929]